MNFRKISKLVLIHITVLSVFALTACGMFDSDRYNRYDPASPDYINENDGTGDSVKSGENIITDFEFTVDGATYQATVDNTTDKVNVTVAAGTDVSSLAPVITVSEGATVDPASGEAQDFSSPVTYTVEAEDGTTRTYTVTVTVSGSAGDTTPPQVSTISPASNASDVALNAIITVTFNEALDASTVVYNSTFLVRDQGSTIVPGTLDTSGNPVIVFTPDSNLTAAELYTITLTAGIEDQSGNSLANAVTSSFTAGTSADTTGPEVASTVPDTSDANVPVINSEISIEFTESINGQKIQNGGIVVMYEKNGSTYTQAGAISYDNSSLTATFTPDTALAYEASYSVTVKAASVEDTSGNPMAQDYNFSFTTESEVDNTPPQISSTSPSDGVLEVNVSSSIYITFSEEMTASLLTSENITVSSLAAADYDLFYDPTGSVLTIDPAVDFSYNTEYTVTVDPLVEDTSGNTLDTSNVSNSFSFTTAAEPDITAPEVASTWPGDGSAGISTSATISITFSEQMDANSVQSSVSMVDSYSDPVTFTLSYNEASMIATITPDASLVNGEKYTVTVSTGAMDLAENSLESAYTFFFITELPMINVTSCSFNGSADPVTVTCAYDDFASGSVMILRSDTEFTSNEVPQNGNTYSVGNSIGDAVYVASTTGVTSHDDDVSWLNAGEYYYRAHAYKEIEGTYYYSDAGYRKTAVVYSDEGKVVGTSKGVLYVDKDYAGGDSNGLKAAPYTDIETAITSASAAFNNAEIHVTGGEYAINSDPLDLVEGISLIGGYSADFSERDASTNETRLEGQSAATLIEGSTGITNATVVDGFTVYPYDTLMSNAYGIKLVNGASPVIRNCKIFPAKSPVNSPSYTAIDITGDSSAKIYNNLIFANWTSVNNTRGINIDGASLTASVQIVNNTINGGSGTSSCLGIQLVNDCDGVTINNNIIFTDNTGSMDRYCIKEYSIDSDPSEVMNNNTFNCGDGFYDDYNDIMVTLSGGNFCVDATTCLSTPTATGNITDNLVSSGEGPGFVDATNGNFHLNRNASFDVRYNALDPTAAGTSFFTDLDGSRRTGNANAGYSMGAYEYVGSWDASIAQLDDINGGCNNIIVKVSPAEDRMIAAWNAAFANGVFASEYNAGPSTWTGQTNLGSADDGTTVDLAIGTTGVAFAVWMSSGNIMTNRYDSGWGTSENITNMATNPRVAVKDATHAFVVFQSGDKIGWGKFAGSFWSAFLEGIQDSTPAALSSIIAGDNIGPLALWLEGDSSESLITSYYEDPSWVTNSSDIDDYNNHISPDYQFETNGKDFSYTVWLQNDGSYTRVFGASYEHSGLAWSTPGVIDSISSAGVTVSHPALTVFPDGTALAVWVQDGSLFYNICSDPGNNDWSGAQKITEVTYNTDDVRIMKAAAGKDGTAFIAWANDNGTTYGYYAARFDGSTWGDPETIADNVILNNSNNVSIDIAVDSVGRASVLYVDFDTYDVVFAKRFQ